MNRILVVYHTQTGNTRCMAEAVAAGAEIVENTTVSIKTAEKATIEDLIDCNGLAIGSPEYFGYMAGMIKDFFDRTYESARTKPEVFKKPYILFISAGNDGRGARDQIDRICSGYPLKQVLPALIIREAPRLEALKQCRELGQTLAAGCDIGIY